MAFYAPLGALAAGVGGFRQGQKDRDESQARQWDIMGMEALGKAFQPQPGPIDQMNRGPQPPPPGQASMPPQPPMQGGQGGGVPLPPPRPPEAPQQVAAGAGGMFGGMPGWSPGERPIGFPQPQAAPPAAGGGGPPPGLPPGPGGGPSQQPQPGAAPPQQGPGGMPQLDLQTLAQRIQQTSPGLPPQALISALTRATPLLSAQGKAELAQLRLEMQKQGLDLRKESMDLRAAAAAKRDDAVASGEDDISQIVKGIKNGDQPPMLNGLYSKSSKVRAGLEREGFNLAKAQQEWSTAQRQIASLNSQRMIQYSGLAKSVMNTIDEVRELSQEMQNIGIPALNKIKLQALINTEGNSPKGQLATRYMTAIGVLKEEFANLANGGYAPTESAWALANEQVNGNYGVQQLDSNLGELRRLIGYRLQNIPNLDTLGGGGANRYTGQPGPAAASPPGAPTPPAAGASPGAPPPPPGFQVVR